MPDDTPRSYPSWRFWEDGRTVIVETPAELAALPPGHAGSPSGPFPAPDQEPPPLARDPEPDPGSSLGQSLREQARAFRDQGLSRKVIAEQLGVTEYTVRRALEDP